MAEVEGGDGGKRKVGNKTDFFKKIKNYGSQLDSDMWQERRERSCEICFTPLTSYQSIGDQNEKTPPKVGFIPRLSQGKII